MKLYRALGFGQAICLLCCSSALITGCHSRSGVKTPKRPVSHEYHGVKVVDPYEWLEKAGDPAVREWSERQNDQARAWLDQQPARGLVEDRLTRLLTGTESDYFALSWRRGRLFLLRFQPPAQQSVLMTLGSLTNLDSGRIILDPNHLNTNGTTTIDWYVPSPDGKLVAVSLSENGSEEGMLYIYETDTGQPRPEAIPRVQGPTAGGSAAWTADSRGLYYTRYPHPGERPEADLPFYQQVYFHQLGTPVEQDTYEVGKEFPRIAEIGLQASPDGRYVLATVANGDGGEYAHYLREPSGQWRRLTRFEDRIARVEFGRDPLYVEWGKDDALYLLSRRDAPKGKILRLPLAQPDLTNAAPFIAEGTNVLHDFLPAASGLFVVYLDGGPSELRYFDYFDKTFYDPRDTETEPRAVPQMVLLEGDEVLARTVTYTKPYAWWRYNPSRDRQRSQSTVLEGKTPVSFGDVEVKRVWVTSKDGTRLPLNILAKKGTRRSGETPAILTGYGGYGVSLTPNFDVMRRVWFDQGGLIAIAHLRGGGEFGDAWHQAGRLTQKQNVFDDFAACAEFLIRSNYTKPSKLAIEGASNGGLLMGATLTQRPDLIQAVVAHVGIYDMLRVELDPNGAFNVTEFGTVKEPAQFQALQAYSPYHQVKHGTNYPAVLMLTGEHDGRVNPAHSRKMVARLQAATGSEHPVLLRSSSKSGHGAGTALNELVQQVADVYAFLLTQLGVDYSIVDRGPWSGAVTPTSAQVKAKLVREGMSARLLVSKTPTLTQPMFLGPERSETNHGNVVGFSVNNLEPDTPYYYGLEVEGRLERNKLGAFRTFPPPGPASFTMAWASCAKTGSTSDVFDRIRENRPLFYMNVGDFHYADIRTNDRVQFRAAYDAVLASPQQAELYRNIPLVYIWDDHDFGGNNAGGSARSEEAAWLSYEEYMPHYPLPFTDTNAPICQSFTVGRVKFILTDLRSQRDDLRKRDNAEKTMLGARQKEWLKQELLSAKDKYPLICWVMSDPWIGQARSNYYHWVRSNEFGFIHHTNYVASADTRTNRNRFRADDDHWSMFATERTEIADFIKSNRVSGVCILHGDSHMLAADDGRHADFATGGGAPIPVMCAAPLDRDPSIKGGYYSQGVYRVDDKAGESAFGLLTVTDQGERIDVVYSGRNNHNEEKVWLKFSVPAANAIANKRQVADGASGSID